MKNKPKMLIRTGAIAEFLDYRDPPSKSTRSEIDLQTLQCKVLKSHVDFVKVKRLNAFINAESRSVWMS